MTPTAADVESAPQKKPGSTRSRKTTPRSRAKKSPTAAAEAKKATTPRRRASPRSRRKTPENEPNDKKAKDQKMETTRGASPPPSSLISTVKEEQEEGEIILQEKEREIAKDTGTKTETKQLQEETELPPAQDTQLRRNYLQRMYRQLQSTHPNQDDTMIRQVATSVEMEACQKSATRSQYVATMDQEIHKLMQFEMEQANTPVYANGGTQSFDSVQGNPQGQSAVASEMQSGYSQHQISQSRSYEYAQALAKAQEHEQANSGSRSSSFSTPRQSVSGDISFQSLMDNQIPGYGQQQLNTPSRGMSMQNQQMGNQFYPTSSMATPTSQSFSIQSNRNDMVSHGTPRTMTEAREQQSNFQMQQPVQQTRTQPRATNFQDFTAQIQHLDKSVLIELLWSQRGALAKWQNQARQLELQLSAQRNAASNMGSPGLPSTIDSPTGSFVTPNVATSAEMQRARERSNSRLMQQQYAYLQQSSGNSAAYSQASGNWGDNPRLYWDKIRVLKATYETQLRTAQRALAHSTVPLNSPYSAKAQAMMQNIGLVLNILTEQPTNVQPRKFEVLTSIERFMQMTVTPIVQKIYSNGGAMAQMSPGSQAAVSSGVTATVDTFSPSGPPTQDNAFGMASDVTQGTDRQNTGTRWASPSWPSSDGFADVEIKSPSGSYGGEGSAKASTPTQILSASPATDSPPPINTGTTYESSEYAPVHAENDNTAVIQREKPISGYEAPTMTPKESCMSSLPSSEFRPSTITAARATFSPSDSIRDTNNSKMMESASVDDSLNDFSEFLDFDGPVAEASNFVKENNPSNISRKRGIGDV